MLSLYVLFRATVICIEILVMGRTVDSLAKASLQAGKQNYKLSSKH